MIDMGLLSLMAQHYATQAGGANQQFYTALGNVMNQYQSSLGNVSTQSNDNLNKLNTELQKLSAPRYQTLNWGIGSGNGDKEKVESWDNLGQTSKSFYNSLGTLSQYDPTAAKQLQSQFQQYRSAFDPAMQGYSATKSDLFNNFSGDRTYNVVDVPGQYSQFLGAQQRMSQQRQGVLSNLTQLGTLEREALTRTNNAMATARQNQLTNRNSWFANQASRDAMRQQYRAEVMGAKQVTKNRGILSRASR